MRSRTLSTNGASPAPLLDDAELGRLHLITLQHRSRRRARSTTGWGDHPARAHGPGLELHDSRPYQAGDDVRRMDWRATARSGKATTKTFVAERARNVFIVVDRRPSMMFGTRGELKAATAARVAAMLSFLALAERDVVAGMVIEHGTTAFPAARRLEGVLPLLRAAAAAPRVPGDATLFAAARELGLNTALARTADRAATLYLIGDFNDVLRGYAAIADYLPGDHRGDRVAIRIVDPAERTLGDAGVLRLVSPHGGTPMVVDTGSGEIRRRYQAAVAEREAELRRHCAAHGVRLIEISSDRDLPAQLEPLL
jgi:uncharacterized protein (DUF58 family)